MSVNIQEPAYGVFIKGIEIPETCSDCVFYDEDEFVVKEYKVCGALVKRIDANFNAEEKRYKDCPMMEVFFGDW